MIELVEVSPRDGLQNEPVLLSTEDKVELVRRAIAAGIRRIEVASFVNPRLVPQMADAEAVVAALPQRQDVRYIGLVLNMRGAERAAETAIQELGIVVPASDTFCTKNQGMDVDAALRMAEAATMLAHKAGKSAQATIAVAFGCPFEGPVAPSRVVAIAGQLARRGMTEIALADTIGIARPDEVISLVRAVAEAIAPLPVRVHFHDTRGMGVANSIAAVAAGAVTVDASIGGTGGCPFAPGAAGNVASEDVAYAFGRRMAADIRALSATGWWLGGRLGRAQTSALMRVYGAS